MKSKPLLPGKKILIIDDHVMIREGLIATIQTEPGLHVCGAFATGHEGMAAIKTLKPDLVMMDITLPDKNGLELLKDITAAYPQLPVLILSMHVDSLYAERALRAGARGYVTKQQPLKILLEAIHAVLDGRIYMSEQASENILRRLSGPGTGSRAATEGLTDREFEVFQLIGDGQDNDHIASRLHLSPKTVAVHSTNIRGKLKLPSYVDLVRYAILQQQVRNLSAPP